jgi:hypothetical protein
VRQLTAAHTNSANRKMKERRRERIMLVRFREDELQVTGSEYLLLVGGWC